MEAESNIIGGGASIMNENVNIASKLYAHKKLRFSLILLFNGITKLKEIRFFSSNNHILQTDTSMLDYLQINKIHNKILNFLSTLIR